MARKNTLISNPIVIGQSLSSSFITPPTVISYMDNCSYQVNVSTTDSTGSFSVQVSSDYGIQETTNAVYNAGNWVTLQLGGGTPSASGANDIISISLNQLPYTAIRLAYTSNVAGTGTCSIYMTNKQIGG